MGWWIILYIYIIKFVDEGAVSRVKFVKKNYYSRVKLLRIHAVMICDHCVQEGIPDVLTVSVYTVYIMYTYAHVIITFESQCYGDLHNMMHFQ